MEVARAERVLIVEDDRLTGTILSELLTSGGYSVSWAEDGEQALAMVASDGPDIILLDLILPKMDGFEVCRRLKSDSTTQFIPILVVTVLTDEASRIRGYGLGADDYIPKPFNRIEVLTRVKSLIRKKQLYDELQAKVVALQRLEETKRALVQFVVHDMQNPLAAVLANIDLACREATEMQAKRLESFLLDAFAGVNRMGNMVRSLLDTERMEEGRLDLEMARIDMGAVVDTAVAMSRPAASVRGVSIKVEAVPRAMVDGDEGLLQRVVLNLLGNAIRFAPETSSVTVTVRCDDARVLVLVRDAGPGVSKVMRDTIFEKYRQGTSKRERDSAGLGLTFCKMAIDAHAGTIWVEDTPAGKGATFVVALPGVLDGG